MFLESWKRVFWSLCKIKSRDRNDKINFRGLSDMNGDGKMDLNEFSVACKLINLKLKGMELPKTLPPQVKYLA